MTQPELLNNAVKLVNMVTHSWLHSLILMKKSICETARSGKYEHISPGGGEPPFLCKSMLSWRVESCQAQPQFSFVSFVALQVRHGSKISIFNTPSPGERDTSKKLH